MNRLLFAAKHLAPKGTISCVLHIPARSRVSLPTVRRFEARSKLRVSEDARLKIEAALEAAGIEFTNGDAPGVRLHRRSE